MNEYSEILLVVPIREGYSGITIDLGLLYLYGALKASGINATIVHCPKEKISEAGWEEILKRNPHIKIIGFKMYSVDHNSVKRMSRIAKSTLPNCVTIAGGPHPTSLPDYVISDIVDLDFLMKGEGDKAFPSFCRAILSGGSCKHIPGITYISGKEIVSNNRDTIEDLDTLPRIPWEDIEIAGYPDFLSSLPFIPVMATRGCPYECRYCASHTIVGRKMRFRSVENVVDELLFLKKVKGAKSVAFSDDELTLNRKYIVKLCNTIIEKNVDIKWECTNGIRLDTLDEELLDLMYKAGCRYAAIGIESASDAILTSMKKSISVDTIREKMRLMKRSKIIPQGLFMIGFPGETEKEILDTIRFSLELDIDKTNFSIFTPLPGSEIFGELIARKELELDKIDWDKMKPDAVAWFSGGTSPERLKELQKYAYRKFYLRPKPIARLAAEFIFKKGAGGILWSKMRSVFWH